MRLEDVKPKKGAYYLLEKQIKSKHHYTVLVQYKEKSEFKIIQVVDLSADFRFVPKLGNTLRPSAIIGDVDYFCDEVSTENNPEYFL